MQKCLHISNDPSLFFHPSQKKQKQKQKPNKERNKSWLATLKCTLETKYRVFKMFSCFKVLNDNFML